MACRLANEFAKEGNSVTYSYYYESGEFELEKTIQRVAFCKKLIANKIQRTLFEIISTRRFFKKNKFDCVLALGYSPAIEFELATIGFKASDRVIMSERNDPYNNVKSTIQKKLRNWAYRRADQIVFQTEDACKYFPSDIQKKGVLIPNPISSDLPAVYEGEREKTIVSAGRLNHQKNLPLLIRAYSRIQKEYPDYRLVIYGDGEEKQRLHELCESLHCTDSVEFPGFKTDVLNRINKASVYVSSSDFEGISNSVLEALALGIPTVATDCPIGGNRLMIQNMINGILTTVGNEDELYEGIKKVITNSTLSRNLSKNATMVRDTFSINNITSQWMKVMLK